MTLPTVSVWVDFDADGAFSGGDDITSYVESAEWTGGRNATFSDDAQGSATVVLKNSAGTFNSNLRPGLPVTIRSNYSSTDRAHFYGFIQVVSPDAWAKNVTVTCYDPLRTYASIDVVAHANTYVTRCARDFRLTILEDIERGTRNYIPNPSFETNTTGWSVSAGTITRITSDNAPGAGAACGSWAPGAGGRTLTVRGYLLPMSFAGQIYRGSFYLKGAGATSVTVGFLNGAVSIASKTVSVTTSWQRFTLSASNTADAPASADNGIGLKFTSSDNTVIKVDAVAITRGAALYPYADSGTGRWPNHVANGGFDGQDTDGWFNAWSNLITNPSFETNTTGWSASTDGFVTVGTGTVSRTVGDPNFGSARGNIATTGIGQGVRFAITGTFTAGVTYDFGIYIKESGGGGGYGTMYLGSSGTPADAGSVSISSTPSSYTLIAGSWTPASNRTDAHFALVCADAASRTLRLDGAYVYRRPNTAEQFQNSIAPYSDTGPGGGTSFVTSMAASSTQKKYGAYSMAVVTPANACGIVYDFQNFGAGPYFVSGVQYVMSLWIRPTSSMAYKIGIAGNAADGTWDDSSTTGTATANTWTQITRTWTPSGDRSSGTAYNAVLYIYQTDSTSRTFYVDGVRVIPGSSADDFEMTQWVIPAAAETDILTATAAFSGTGLAALAQINGLVDSRHWIEAELTDPFYSYHVEDRVTYAAKTSSETLSDTFSGFTEADLDIDSVHNTVLIRYNTDENEYYSDETSVDTYGPSAVVTIDGSNFFPDNTIPESLGPSYVTRYGVPRRRPTLELTNTFPTMLDRQVNDVVTVTLTRLGISSVDYSIVSMTTRVSDGMKVWKQTWQLEEF